MKILNPYLLAFYLLSVIALSACGQTGDLYLPEDEPEESVKNRSKS